jgi:hypothetical protein
MCGHPCSNGQARIRCDWNSWVAIVPARTCVDLDADQRGVRPHPTFHRKGDDIEVELPIWLKEAVLDGKIKVPTPTVPVRVGVIDDRQKSPSARATAYRSLNFKNSTWANDSFDY